ncbi:uncharacterized protein LOC128209068 [Mya arenaria]|nr:uncharacterized protein LOC128209068 [Mya arenaria]XP_052768866.1 uncharacterized protein LOC128209068 [Mya arenaria]
MVCEDHMELCCSICVSLNHRMCHSISLVENLAKGIHELAEFKQLPANVSKLTSSLNQVIQDMKKKQQLLKTSGKSTLKEIKALRDTLNQLLEELERRTVEQMDSVLADLDEMIQKDIDSCTNIHGQLKAFLDNVQSQDKGSEPSVYIGYRKCQDKMADAKKQLHEMAIKAEMTVSFQPDNHAVEILTDMLTLGNIQADTAKDARNQSTLSKEHLDTLKAFTVKTKKTYSVQQKTDDKSCDITGITELPGGDIILIDLSNTKVKLLNSQFQVIGSCEVPKHPQDICHTTGNELAVAINCNEVKRHALQFLRVFTGSLIMTERFLVDHCCNSIRHHEGQLYVGSYTALYLYTEAGQLIKVVYEDKSGYLTVNHFALSKDCRKIYIPASKRNSLVTIDNTGNILDTLKDPGINWPQSVHVSEGGQVFVCSSGSHTVVQVTHDGGQKLATLVRQGDGINCPKTAWYSTNTGRLIVGGE